VEFVRVSAFASNWIPLGHMFLPPWNICYLVKSRILLEVNFKFSSTRSECFLRLRHKSYTYTVNYSSFLMGSNVV
jgi:hypothetical protein